MPVVPAVLPPLPYAYDALEPYISKQIMTLHHDKHHQAYVNNLNAAQAKYDKASDVKDRTALLSALNFNGGGHINHSLFWKNLAPSSAQGKGNGGVLKDGRLKKAIVEKYGSFDNFVQEFITKAAGIQGSGWTWLGLAPTGDVDIVTTANQDILTSHTPLFGVDIWEHAFYLQYLNVKDDYLKAIWNVINWDEAEQRYAKAGSSKR